MSTATQTPRVRSFPMPDVGEGLTEAEILEWKVAPGDTVTVNQIIVEIETAKAAVELPCPYAGVVVELLAEPGITLAVGTPIISIDTQPDAGPLEQAAAAAPAAAPPAATGDDEAGSKIGEVAADGRIATLVGYIPAAGSGARRPRKGAAAAGPAPTAGAHVAAGGEPGPGVDAVVRGAQQAETTAAPPAVPAAAGTGPAERRAAPLAAPQVRKLAKDLGVDLASVTPTRADGIISRADVEAAAGSAGTAADAPATGVTAPAVPRDPAERERRVPVKGVRRMTAQAMVSSAFTAPHVTEFLTVDVTPMMELRDRLRADRAYSDVKLTPLTFAAKAVCLASRRTEEINSVWDEQAQEIVVRSYVNLGIAAATPRGLVVPVIRDADAMSLRELAAALGELTATAREGRTSPAAMTGGTVTITNVGVFGVDTGTPIINPGESAILALGSIKDMPWVVDGQLAVRKVCQLALSFDHRVIDGQQGSRFLADVGALLADPGMALTY